MIPTRFLDSYDDAEKKLKASEFTSEVDEEIKQKYGPVGVREKEKSTILMSLTMNYIAERSKVQRIISNPTVILVDQIMRNNIFLLVNSRCLLPIKLKVND